MLKFFIIYLFSPSIQKEVPNIVNETKVLISNEESLRMGQANNVTQRLFTLIDAVSGAKTNFGHENCEAQKKKLLLASKLQTMPN